MYKLVDSATVRRLVDTADIPFVEGNRDYQKYLDWKADGNEPEPADSEPVPDPRALRKAAYIAESDPLYMEWKYDETDETNAYWLDKVRDIKLRYPLPAATASTLPA